MTLIDQRILIDAPTDAVWKIISDSNQLARWHAGYTQVSVLTTLPTGVGARRRCKPVQGKDVIEEITAWVEGLGYEYKIVEGGPYKSFQARIRLQANPDGTSVQWTVVYQPKGLSGAIKNRMGGKRRFSELIATSLRTLKREIDTMGVHMDEQYRAKVSIQGRLNADQRAQYQRRYAPPEKEVPAGDSPEAAGTVPAPAQISVPPVPEGTSIPSAPVPSFVAALKADSPDIDGSHLVDTEPKAPKGLKEAIAGAAAGASTEAPAAQQPAVEMPPNRVIPPEERPFVRPPDQIAPPPPAPDYRRQTPPRDLPAVPISETVQPPVGIQPPANMQQPTQEEKKKTPPRDVPAVEAPNLPPPTPKTDTGEMSIWEVFGMKRPSERDQAVLNELVREMQTRRRSGLDGQTFGGFERRVRARRFPTVLGLRLRLALEAVRIRLHRTHEE